MKNIVSTVSEGTLQLMPKVISVYEDLKIEKRCQSHSKSGSREAHRAKTFNFTPKVNATSRKIDPFKNLMNIVEQHNMTSSIAFNSD